jgi:cellulose synthase/poly-beta-1,6-N-acetylglucosamine synthase-like glycosyltransferase
MIAYGLIAAYIALGCGLFFFFGYALRYYLYVAILFFLNLFGRVGRNGREEQTSARSQSVRDGLLPQPLVSIHLPVFNEPNVVERLLACCTTLDYKNYEVVMIDDSTDETLNTLREWAEKNQVAYTMKSGEVQVTNTIASMQIPIKVVHRTRRSGFKGGALNEALKHMSPDAEYVMIFDADFIPPPDIIKKSLPYFSLPSANEILANVIQLDDSYAAGKLDIDTYVKERERLASKLRGNTAITEGAKLAVKALFTLDQMYVDGEISEYEYKLRRTAIADQMSKIPMAATPYAEESLALHRAFTISQLFAEHKIDSKDYKTRIRMIFAPFNGKLLPTNEYDDLVLKILDLDADYAGGNISDDEYSSKRIELKSKLEVLNGNHDLPNQASANGRNNKQGSTNGTNGTNGNGQKTKNGDGEKFEYVAVQGYQLHSLNQDENWLTAGVRAEFSGSYMIERPAQQFFGAMKMISGSVYMIRADVLKQYRWSESITEDWELTCRLYLDGKRVAYTPTIEASAEAPATLRRLFRQRQRWGEGHSFNAKKYFIKFMTSPNTTFAEKLEYLYYTPYYIQGLFFCVGTLAWFIQLLMGSYLPFWTALLGWGLLLSNTFAIPLMNFAGLVSEGPRRRDIKGVFSAIVLSYIVAIFQGYAALKGFLEPKEGGWVRTYKTGMITQPPLIIRPRSDTLRPVAGAVARPRRATTVAQVRRAPPIAVIILLLASLLAASLILSQDVRMVEALPANIVWYPNSASTLQLGASASGSELILSNDHRLWTTTGQYVIGETSAVSGWIFHLVCTFASRAPANVTANVYYSRDSTRGSLLQTGEIRFSTLNCDGSSENVIPLVPVHWTGTQGEYYLNLEAYTSNSDAQLSLEVGGPHSSYLTDGNSIPEYVLPLIVLAPLIPIAMKRSRKK